MKTWSATVWACAIMLVAAACTSPDTAGREKGPKGTVAYLVQVESSEPGARVEMDGDYVGKTPCTVKIWGDKDGTFHNFGRYTCTIKAYPIREGQFVQTKVFRTGGWFTAEDRVPTRLYFDLGLRAMEPGKSVDVNLNVNQDKK